MAFAWLYLQRTLGYEPCPMCIFQRVAMVAAGLVFLAGALHGPKAWGQWVYAGLAGLTAAGGAGIAGRHVWLQSLPPDQVPSCGPTLDYLLKILPFTEVVSKVLRGDANCAKIDAQWLGLSLPAWTLVAFIGLALFALAMPIITRKNAP
jgi:disulfide bond formation protein DsbB